MATIENVCVSRLIACTIDGVKPDPDVRRLARTITIKESVCTPYLMGELLLLDNDNIIVQSEVPGGTKVSISFDANGGKKYEVDMYILKIEATSSPENFNLKIYTISMVSSEYFTDRGQTVTINSEPQRTGRQLVAAIWQQCGFESALTQPSSDYSFQDGNQPFSAAMVKPFTAIGQIRDIQVYPDKTGNVMFFRNNEGMVHGPLAVIYPAAAAAEEFIQRETWGVDVQHLFGGDNSYHAIIGINEQSRVVMLNPDEYEPDKQITVSMDQNAGKLGANKMFAGIAQGHGINIPHTNSDRVTAEHDPYNIIARARWYAHCMKSTPPKYLVRVPLKTGINITAGGGCKLTLQPTHADPNHENKHTGDYFITDLVHEVHNDLREVNGTTTFNALKKGYCSV